MSFWDYFFDSEWRQRSDIEELKEQNLQQTYQQSFDTGRNKEEIGDLQKKIKTIENQVSHLQRINKALLLMLRESDSWNEELFIKFVDTGGMKASSGEKTAPDNLLDDPEIRKKAEILKKMYGDEAEKRYLDDLRKQKS